jgi:hypothetical protein
MLKRTDAAKCEADRHAVEPSKLTGDRASYAAGRRAAHSVPFLVTGSKRMITRQDPLYMIPQSLLLRADEVIQ